MADQEHLDLLKQGVETWNQWRREHPEIQPDLNWADLIGACLPEIDLSGTRLWGVDFMGVNLSGANLNEARLMEANLIQADLSQTNLIKANLSGAYLNGADLSGADLSRADLIGADLHGADLHGAKLSGTYFSGANLSRANLSQTDLFEAHFIQADLSEADLSKAYLGGAKLNKATLSGADLSEADLSGADLTEAEFTNANLCRANLSGSSFIRTNLTGVNLTDCSIYGISAWNVQLGGAKQLNLVITPPDTPTITVDNLKVAQFIYLLLNNEEIRDVIDTITSKVVLILGRFIPERKAILDVIRNELRKRNYLPVLFDFEKPASRDLTETVSTLAHLARFIVVDLTDPSSAPHEVATVIPQCVVPVQPLLSRKPLMVDGKVVGRREYAMVQDLRRRYHWVLPTFRYQDAADVLESIKEHIIDPAEQKAKELARQK